MPFIPRSNKVHVGVHIPTNTRSRRAYNNLLNRIKIVRGSLTNTKNRIQRKFTNKSSFCYDIACYCGGNFLCKGMETTSFKTKTNGSQNSINPLPLKVTSCTRRWYKRRLADSAMTSEITVKEIKALKEWHRTSGIFTDINPTKKSKTSKMSKVLSWFSRFSKQQFLSSKRKFAIITSINIDLR
ncbi:hypothetical protein SNEBB_007400 [Seison nebaliae]|nr:hypothetical protein SNEBB_007400 [Seison nebaliae]